MNFLLNNWLGCHGVEEERHENTGGFITSNQENRRLSEYFFIIQYFRIEQVELLSIKSIVCTLA